MELTDEQLHHLFHLEVWGTMEDMGTDSVFATLATLELATGNQIDNGWIRYALTKLGREVLQKNMARVLHNVPFVYTESVAARMQRYFSVLTIAELTSLLTHEEDYLRKHAKERMEELLNETNR